MADLSALDNAMVPMGGRDDASRLVAALLRAHQGDQLKNLPITMKVLPAVYGGQGQDALGAYVPKKREASLRQLDQPSYKHPVGGLEPQNQLTTENVLNLYQTALHELQHSKSFAARGHTTDVHGGKINIMQYLSKQGIPKNKVIDAAADIATGKHMPSAQATSNPEILFEEFLAYGIPAREAYSKNVRLKENDDVLGEIKRLTYAHPWLEKMMADWTDPSKLVQEPADMSLAKGAKK